MCSPMFCFYVLLFLCCLGLVCSQQCNNSTYPYTFNQTSTLKSGASNKLRLGLIGSFADREFIAANAFTYYLNNKPDILPDVAIELYESTSPTTSDVLVGALYYISTLKINGLICGYTSTESRTAQLAGKIYSIPQISPNALSYTLSNKGEYPLFMRTIPADTIQISGIIALFQELGWHRAIVVYTNDDYGSGYQRLSDAGASKNITFYPISLSATATKAADVVDTLNSVIQAVTKQDYRIIVYYAQRDPTNTLRASLNATGIFGPQYVSVLTAAVAGQYIFLSGTTSPLNDNVIALTVAGQRGAVFDDFFNYWNSSSSTIPYPVQVPFYASYYLADAILSFAVTMDQLMKNGVPFTSIKGTSYYNSMKNMSFTGTTGRVSFDQNGDRLGDYSFYSLTPTGAKLAGLYSIQNDSFVKMSDFIFFGGSTVIPKDGPYKCANCLHGDCVENVGCVCHKGYKGVNCDESKGSKTGLIGGILGGGAFMIIFIIIVFFMYRRQKYQLVKEVAEKQRSNINRSDLKLHERIGRGASGEVFRGSFRGTDVAVKKIITTSVDKSVIQEFELEVAIMCGLRHPNIILFMGSSYDAEGKEMLLVMELMARGSLHDVLHNPQISMNLEMKLHLACQAAQGMNFLHQSSPPIIHRDLKSHNILLDDKWNARISDFGITKFKETTKEAKSNAKQEKSMGTIYWTAPEVLEGKGGTEKSDVYSFGIVLWEIFHNKNPYAGRDPISVALDVIHNNLRPPINKDIPRDMQELIRACWDGNADVRPSFEDIMGALRSMSMKNPSYSLNGGGMRVEAPTGHIYLVKTCIQDAFSVWESAPQDMCEAMYLHNGLIRANIELYRGYESNYNFHFHSFLIAFSNLEDALNFCIATQISLLNVHWPINVLKHPSCAQVNAANGEMIWNGLRVLMSIYSGVPNCERDIITDRMTYTGPVAEKAHKMIQGIKKGSIVVTDTIVEEYTKKKSKVIQSITTRKCGEMNDSARDRKASIHRVIIACLQERENYSITSPEIDPHVLVTVENDNNNNNIINNDVLVTSYSSPNAGRLDVTLATDRSGWDANNIVSSVEWLAHFPEIQFKEKIGQGSMGDYTRATWKNKDVAVKMLINQKLKEGDLLRLLSDSAIMSKISHPNILPFYAVCVDPGHLCMISEYMAKGNLKAKLADPSVAFPFSRKIQIAISISHGMSFLSRLSSFPEMQKHDNLKSNNILIGKDGEVKIADYGQSNLKDLARTMTSVGSVAWTAPELLSGEGEASPKIATYSFGIILWEIYTREVPYANEHPIRVVTKILSGYRPPIPVGCPPHLASLITDCLSTDPEERPSWDAIISILNDISIHSAK